MKGWTRYYYVRACVCACVRMLNCFTLLQRYVELMSAMCCAAVCDRPLRNGRWREDRAVYPLDL